MTERQTNQSMAAIRNALVDAQVWWYAGRNLTGDLGYISNARPDELSSTHWERNLRMAVATAIRERRQLLEQANLLRAIQAVENTGKLLVFEPEFTMSDGLAAGETAGVIDVHNCPSSNFWLGFVPRLDEQTAVHGEAEVLVSWIPDELTATVSRGINVIAEGCLDWVDSERWKTTRLGQRLLSVIQGRS